jgi:hypothetical protein
MESILASGQLFECEEDDGSNDCGDCGLIDMAGHRNGKYIKIVINKIGKFLECNEDKLIYRDSILKIPS